MTAYHCPPIQTRTPGSVTPSRAAADAPSTVTGSPRVASSNHSPAAIEPSTASRNVGLAAYTLSPLV